MSKYSRLLKVRGEIAANQYLRDGYELVDARTKILVADRSPQGLPARDPEVIREYWLGLGVERANFRSVMAVDSVQAVNSWLTQGWEYFGHARDREVIARSPNGNPTRVLEVDIYFLLEPVPECVDEPEVEEPEPVAEEESKVVRRGRPLKAA